MNLRHLALLPLVGLTLGTTVAMAAPITYQLKDWGRYRSGTHLGGSITVNDADGNRVIAPDEIVDWSITGTTIPSYATATTLQPFELLHEPGAQPACSRGSCFLLDGMDLVLDIRTQGAVFFSDAVGNRFDVGGDSGLGGDAIQGDWIAVMRWGGGGFVGSTELSMIGDPLMRIATVAGTVPEPSTVALVLAGLAAGAAGLRVRRAGPGAAAG
jgi:hypothetical protein